MKRWKLTGHLTIFTFIRFINTIRNSITSLTQINAFAIVNALKFIIQTLIKGWDWGRFWMIIKWNVNDMKFQFKAPWAHANQSYMYYNYLSCSQNEVKWNDFVNGALKIYSKISTKKNAKQKRFWHRWSNTSLQIFVHYSSWRNGSKNPERNLLGVGSGLPHSQLNSVVVSRLSISVSFPFGLMDSQSWTSSSEPSGQSGMSSHFLSSSIHDPFSHWNSSA